MDYLKVLNELRTEQTRLAEAILAVERLARGGAKRRGRPPAWLKKAESGKPADKPKAREASA